VLAVGIISAAGALMSGAAAVISTLAVLGFLPHRPRPPQTKEDNADQ
jgi:hypothetical protein